MKKLLIALMIVLFSVSSGFAIGAGPTIRSCGMGGTGIGIANDISAAYFNPAGLMYGPENFEAQLFAGGATAGLTGLTDALGDTDKFLTDFFTQDFKTSSSVSGGLGVSVKKVGVSVIAMGNVNFNKPAGTLPPPTIKIPDLNFGGLVNAAMPITLGSSISTPGLPLASLAVGVNLKPMMTAMFQTNIISKAGALTGEGTSSIANGSGFGFDIGAMAKVTPLISVGAVIRNLSASVNILTKSKSVTMTKGAGDTVEITDGAEVETKSVYTPAPEVGVGAGFLFPLTGTLVAVDLENYSLPDNNNLNQSKSYTDTHIGIEQGFLLNVVMLRAGYFTDGPNMDSFYTYGFGLNMGPTNLGVAAANSVSDSRNSVAQAQMGMAF